MIDLLKQVCQKLEIQNIMYMLSGSLALNAYIIPRMTRDIDLVIKIKEEQIPLFLKSFENDFYCYPPSVLEGVQNKGMFNFINHATGIKIDFIVCKNNDFRETEFNRRQQTDVFGFDTWIVTIEDLILSKIIWIQELQSEKQIEDIKNLCLIPEIDFFYIKSWIEKLKLNTFDLI